MGDRPRAASMGEGDLSLDNISLVSPFPCTCGDTRRWPGDTERSTLVGVRLRLKENGTEPDGV